MFDLKYTEKSKKFLKKLDKQVARRITLKIECLKEKPFRYLEHFEGEGYKLRIGDFRAIIDINFDAKLLIVRIIDKRGRVYKR